MKNAFYFILKALLFLRYFNFSSEFLICRKAVCKKTKVNIKVYDVTDWITDDYDTHIT